MPSETAIITLELENLTLRVAGRTLLAGADFSFPATGISVVFGRSGTGKSTLLKALCQLLPHEGSVLLGGINLDDFKPEEARTRIQYLHQEPWLFPGTVRENLELPSSFKQNRGRIDDRMIGRHLEGLGLESGILEHDAEKLSGGEKQRLALARALLRSPEILILD